MTNGPHRSRRLTSALLAGVSLVVLLFWGAATKPAEGPSAHPLARLQRALQQPPAASGEDPGQLPATRSAFSVATGPGSEAAEAYVVDSPDEVRRAEEARRALIRGNIDRLRSAAARESAGGREQRAELLRRRAVLLAGVLESEAQ